LRDGSPRDPNSVAVIWTLEPIQIRSLYCWNGMPSMLRVQGMTTTWLSNPTLGSHPSQPQDLVPDNRSSILEVGSRKRCHSSQLVVIQSPGIKAAAVSARVLPVPRTGIKGKQGSYALVASDHPILTLIPVELKTHSPGARRKEPAGGL
jgi:hypothetical protein